MFKKLIVLLFLFFIVFLFFHIKEKNNSRFSEKELDSHFGRNEDYKEIEEKKDNKNKENERNIFLIVGGGDNNSSFYRSYSYFYKLFN